MKTFGNHLSAGLRAESAGNRNAEKKREVGLMLSLLVQFIQLCVVGSFTPRWWLMCLCPCHFRVEAWRAQKRKEKEEQEAKLAGGKTKEETNPKKKVWSLEDDDEDDEEEEEVEGFCVGDLYVT